MRVLNQSFSASKFSTELFAIGAPGEVLEKFTKGQKVEDGILFQAERLLRGTLRQTLKNKGFSGKPNKSEIVEYAGEKKLRAVLIFALDPSDAKESFRLFGAAISKAAKNLKLSKAFCSLHAIAGNASEEFILEGAMLADYSFTPYQSTPVKALGLKEIIFDRKEKINGKSLSNLKATTEGVMLARDLGNTPPNDCTPLALVEVAKSIGKECGLSVTVFNRKQLEKMGAGALLAVAKGSVLDPFLIKMTYEPQQRSSEAHVAFVGKGITYDTGGYSLKPSGSMDGMKFDMCGAAAVLGAMQAIGKIKPSVKVTAYIPTCENMVNGEATRPGDVVKSLNGKTIEILNTDAEGRLILADALALAIDDGATELIDLATLTGGILVALGTGTAGLFSNNVALASRIKKASADTGEKIWELPLLEDHRDDLKSNVADIKNIPGHRWAQSSIAAMFLEAFVKKTPWVHLDIAGVADSDSAKGYHPKGATGFGVRMLVQYAVSK